ncbi:MAG: MFS transporter [Christensenellales bacterium]|jgi:sugar phosphate permease
MLKNFSKVQRRILLGCFIAYCTTYLGRLNLSQALPGIIREFSLSDAQAGLFQTVFAAIYAVGQLINGAIVDRIDENKHILIGIAASALCNMLFGAFSGFPALLLLWALNGAAQSMIWTPIVKILANRFDQEQQSVASYFMSITLVAGHLAAWAISGIVTQLFSWRLSFAIPGIAMSLLAPISFLMLKSEPSEKESAVWATQARERGSLPLLPLIFGTGLWAMLLGCTMNGFARDGVMAWAPTLLSGGSDNPVLSSLLIPILNLVGILFGKLCYRRYEGKARAVVGMMMALGTIPMLLLAGVQAESALVLSLLLGCNCALMYGINPLLTVLVPLEYASVRRVALVAGLVNGFIYAGSSLTGVVTGGIIDAFGMNGAYIAWAAVCVVGAALFFLSVLGKKKLATGSKP